MEPKKSLKLCEIKLSFEEIQTMNPNKYKNIVRIQARNMGFKYLLEKQDSGKKGKLISYHKI